jgi:hypothetical protein
MDLTGIKGAVQELEQFLPKETAQLFTALDLSVQKAVTQLDDLLTKHEGNLATFLDGFEITISFKRKTNQ